jgi:hypothetical protein
MLNISGLLTSSRVFSLKKSVSKLYSLHFYSNTFTIKVKAESMQDLYFIKPDWVLSKKVSEYIHNFSYIIFVLIV